MSSRPVLFKRGFSQGVVLLVLLVAIGGVVAAAAYTETDKYCSSCHSMQPSADTWAMGAHSKTGCAECHMKPGFKGWFENRFSIARMRKVEKAGGATSFAGIQVDDGFCTRCHANAANSGGTDEVAIPHSIHSAGLDIACYDCHEGVVHGIDGQPMRAISHDKCITCHQEWFAEDTADCAKCHIKSTVTATEKLAIPHETHSFLGCQDCHVEYVLGAEGKIGHGTCMACHEGWFDAADPSCESCHINLDFNETANMKIPHGSHIAFGCESCHADQLVPAGDGLSHASCESCHGDWFEVDCLNCHKW